MSNENFNEIAIIGISCKFPKSDSVQQYWENIKEGHECLVTITDDELEQAGVDRTIYQQNNYIKRASSITDIDKFDADFFKISPKEASYMDPQQRLLLEKAWEAIEDAGINIEHINKKVAVFASTSASSYFMENLLNNKNFVEEAGGIKAVLHGLDKDHIATKIAYKLNLTGPAITVQCACSSSMVGAIMACQNLLTYQCDMAIAGGVTINVPQQTGYMYEKGNIMSQDGYCRPFDEDASGTIFGSGVACIVLKRLEDAINDKNHIYSVIKGFSVGNDGNDKVGYTAPGIKGQMDVISEALEFAQIDPSTISYVEAHGTGTIMGDPIEVEAISRVYEQYTSQKQYCAIGSVKANVGHLNVASGIAGIIKAALAIENKIIPPLINIRQENRKINFKESPFYINRQWKAYSKDTPMRVAVSSFGIGGTNGHIIMEKYKEESCPKLSKGQYLIPISGRDREDIKQACINLVHYLRSYPTLDMADIERTLQCGRKDFQVRKTFIVQNIQELIQEIENWMKESDLEEKTDWLPLQVELSGSVRYDRLYVKKTYEDSKIFKKHMDYFNDILKRIYSIHITDILNDDFVFEEHQHAVSLIVTSAMIKAWEELGLEVEVIFEDNIHYDNVKTFENIIRLKEFVATYLEHVVLKKNEYDTSHLIQLGSKDFYETFLLCVGKWWENGNEVKWEKWIDSLQQNIISLPTYPFKRNSYWVYSPKLKKSKDEEPKTDIMASHQVYHNRPALDTEYVPPENDLQEMLVQIWSGILGAKEIGIKDNFFELGGHSLMATELIAIIMDEFLIEIEMNELFDCLTILEMAEMIKIKLSNLIEQMDDNEVAAYLETENKYD